MSPRQQRVWAVLERCKAHFWREYDRLSTFPRKMVDASDLAVPLYKIKRLRERQEAILNQMEGK